MSTANPSLSGKVAIVTGAASGIGEQIARTLAEAGARVVIADMNLTGAQRVADDIGGRGGKGGQAMAVAMDVTDERAVDDGFGNIEAAFGPVDIVINNAGVQIVSPIDQFSLGDWKKILAIHLDGAFLVTRAALRQMYRKDADGQARGGTVIFMGSVHSHEASPLKSAYVTAKHGLLGLSRTLAKEGAAHGVRSHVVCPGFVRTALVEKQIPEQARSLGISEEEVVKNVMLRGTVDGEFTTTEDVAETVRFLAAFPSAALTGQVITVSHGWNMH
ncbi:3-hydroxybutyrate dehydrogenase [Chitinasiproducens palmae]|uniref:3-hydroxybutyrate dehydrogenase n=1 Tax=Chitinasiproducens palmae TaxID=1770053 RepID=A0A1H2PSG1_9BURK|nr:3-hydroxybutyrate dehydrogenase [Chitinasiproducens palmae]SDV49960.1 3-hydroxybutyrate dehydrogenase [Chitinasiproducens palmae]